MMKLQEGHINYIEQQFDLMRKKRMGIDELLLEAHHNIAAYVQAVAVVASPTEALMLLEALANNVRQGDELLSSMNKGFHLKVNVMRDIWHMPGDNA